MTVTQKDELQTIQKVFGELFATFKNNQTYSNMGMGAAVAVMLVTAHPVPVAGKTAAMAPVKAVAKVAAVTTMAAAVVVAAHPVAPVAVMTTPVTEVLRADPLRGRLRATVGRPLPAL